MLKVKNMTDTDWFATCKSTDVKPLKAPNGAFLFELADDGTGKAFMFDQDTEKWIEIK